MRTGGAGLFGSSDLSQATAQLGPALSIGARGCSISRGLPSGIASCAAARSARAALTDIACPIDVDHAAGRGRRSLGGQPADRLGDFVGRSNSAERDVGDDLRTAATLQIFRRHLRHGKARRDAEAEDSFTGIAARERPGHAHHRRLRRRIVPVLWRIAAEGGAAGDVDDPAPDLSPGTAAVEEMRHGEAAEVGGRLEVDGKGPVPRCVPFLVRGIIGDGLIDAGIVDQHVDLAAELIDRGVPNVARRRRAHQVTGDELIAALRRMADHTVAMFLEMRISGRADPAAGAGDEDIHEGAISTATLAPLRGILSSPARGRGGDEGQAAMPLTKALVVDLKLVICSEKRPKPCSTWSMSLATFSVSLRIAAMVELIESAASAVSSTAAVIIVTVCA